MVSAGSSGEFIDEAVTLPIQQPRIERIALSDLPKAQMDLKTTLVIPPATVAKANQLISDKLKALVTSGRLIWTWTGSRLQKQKILWSAPHVCWSGLWPNQNLQLYLDLYTNAETMVFVGEPLPPEKAINSFQSALRINAKTPFKRLFLTIVEQGRVQAYALSINGIVKQHRLRSVLCYCALGTARVMRQKPWPH